MTGLADMMTTTATNTQPYYANGGALSDYQGKQYDPSKLFGLQQQIYNRFDKSNLTGDAWNQQQGSIGFDYNTANPFFKNTYGRDMNSGDQIALDMARQLSNYGISDLSQLQYKSVGNRPVQITSPGNQGYWQPNGGDGGYFHSDPNAKYFAGDYQLTPEEVAQYVKFPTGPGQSLDGTDPVYNNFGTMDRPSDIKALYGPDGNIFQPKMGSLPRATFDGNGMFFGDTYTGKGGTFYGMTPDANGNLTFSTHGGRTDDFSAEDARGIAMVLGIAGGAAAGLYGSGSGAAGAGAQEAGAAAGSIGAGGAGEAGVLEALNSMPAWATTGVDGASLFPEAAAGGAGGSVLGELGSRFGDLMKIPGMSSILPKLVTGGLAGLFGGGSGGNGGASGSNGGGGMGGIGDLFGGSGGLGGMGLNDLFGLAGGLNDMYQQNKAGNTMIDWLKNQQSTMNTQGANSMQQLTDFINNTNTNLNGQAGTARQQTMDWLNGQQDRINNLYAPGSPEYNLMKQEMERKDAAAGRNSQYGVRATELAGKLAQIKGDLNTRFATGTAGTVLNANNLQADLAQRFNSSALNPMASMLARPADRTLQFTTGTSKALADALTQKANRFSGLSAAAQRAATPGGNLLNRMGNAAGSTVGKTLNDMFGANDPWYGQPFDFSKYDPEFVDPRTVQYAGDFQFPDAGAGDWGVDPNTIQYGDAASSVGSGSGDIFDTISDWWS